MTGPAFCTHGRLGDHCEDCALIAAAERGVPVGTPIPAQPAPELAMADDDLVFDHGDGRTVLIAAGDPIPADLADLPHRPRSQPATPKRSRRT